jgi:hypothetical protein
MKNNGFQYMSVAEQSEVIFIALTKSDSDRKMQQWTGRNGRGYNIWSEN